MNQYFNYLDHQDFKTVIIKKNNDNNAKNEEKKNINNELEKKLEKKVNENNLKHKKIDINLKNNLINSRVKKKLTQKELANKCNLSIKIIVDIESGKANYNANHINKIKNLLK